MLVELNGKGGRVCGDAKAGRIRCPLMIRPTSEDVITSEIFSSLQCIDPRWWLPDLLNTAICEGRFRRQIYRKLSIKLWVKQKSVPKSLVPWNEGQTEVDVEIRWENPPTTVFMEMKYGSLLSKNTVHSKGEAEYPTDQLIRNIRVGLWKSGWYAERRLFPEEPRDFYTVLFSPRVGNELVDRYRSNENIWEAIPNSSRLIGLPGEPFVGEASFGQLRNILRANVPYLSWSERSNAKLLDNYLNLKLSQVNGRW